jgi:hypothetical protein
LILSKWVLKPANTMIYTKWEVTPRKMGLETSQDEVYPSKWWFFRWQNKRVSMGWDEKLGSNRVMVPPCHQHGNNMFFF